MILILAVRTAGEHLFAQVTQMIGVIVGTLAGYIAANITDVVAVGVLIAA